MENGTIGGMSTILDKVQYLMQYSHTSRVSKRPDHGTLVSVGWWYAEIAKIWKVEKKRAGGNADFGQLAETGSRYVVARIRLGH